MTPADTPLPLAELLWLEAKQVVLNRHYVSPFFEDLTPDVAHTIRMMGLDALRATLERVNAHKEHTKHAK